MNLGLSELQKSLFNNYLPVPRPIFNYTDIPDLNWIAGFSSGEGCFLVSIFKSNLASLPIQFFTLFTPYIFLLIFTT